MARSAGAHSANDRLRNAGPQSGYAPGNTKYSSVKLSRARPQDGAVLVKLAQPWPACTVGDRFNGVYLTIGATHKYRLDGLEVARCSGDEVAFVYARAQPE